MTIQSKITALSQQAPNASVVETMREVLIRRFDIDASDLSDERALDSLGLDSLGFVEYVFEVEKALNITLPDVPRDISTVGALVGLIEREVAKQHGEQTRA